MAGLAQLPLFHHVAGCPVAVVGTGPAAEAKRRLVERAGAVPCSDLDEAIVAGARLAFIAHEDADLAQADVNRARGAGLLVNAADRPELCDFTVPSLLDRDPVLIAVGTGGASAGLSKQLRLRLEALLPQSLGALATALRDARDAMRARWPAADARRRALDEALGAGGVLDPLREDSAARVTPWLSGDYAEVQPEVVEIVLRSDDPDDLTLRELRWLGAADVIVSEARVPQMVLDRCRADAERRVILEGGGVSVGDGLTVVLRGPSSEQPG